MEEERIEAEKQRVIIHALILFYPTIAHLPDFLKLSIQYHNSLSVSFFI